MGLLIFAIIILLYHRNSPIYVTIYPVIYDKESIYTERMMPMSIRRDIPLEEFEIIISPPSNRLASMCVNIYEDGKFNLNGKLAAKIGGKKLEIRLTRDGKYLCLIENGNIAFPKSGSCKIPEVIAKLKDAKISFPAKYEIMYSDATQTWQGPLEENPIMKPSEKAHSTRKRSNS